MSSTDSDRYDIFFAGECLAGRDPRAVREALGRLFKADGKTLDRLFCGQRQRVKGECDRATARRYQQAFADAGARVVIARAAAAPAPTASSPAASSPAAAPPDRGRLTLADAGERLGPAAPEAVAVAPPNFDLAEVGADLGPPPSAPPPAAPDTSQLALAGEGGDLSDCAPEPAPAPALDLSHMELAEAGSDLLSSAERERPQAAAPDTAHLTLAPDADPAPR